MLRKNDMRQIIGEAVVAALTQGGQEIVVSGFGPGVSIRPAEKRGWWIGAKDEPGFYICSVCGETQDWGHWKYCPDCGARMEAAADA